MNKKGFVLMETIVVIVVVSVALLTIFSSYNKILSKLRTENKYDTSEYIYMTKYIKDSMNADTEVQDIVTENNITNYTNSNLKSLYGVEKIYLLTNLNNFGGNETNVDAYMIDYIKKLDVRNQDKLLIVEYKRVVKDTNNEDIRMATCREDMKNADGKCPILYETYIASLEWD